jgi:N-acetylglucosaminyldiphosphoundecaprenol N-acetyl-beta-D-mannosaminyltransferase
MNIFGVRVEPSRPAEIPDKLDGYFHDSRAHQIVTVNPEMLMAARTARPLAEALSQASLQTADGIGLVWFLRLFGQPVARCTGMDLLDLIIQKALQEQRRILFLCVGGDRAVRAAQELSRQHPGLQILGIGSGDLVDEREGKWSLSEEEQRRIRAFAPEIVCVSLGVGRQEPWIQEHLHDFPSVRIMVGVGGVFAFLCKDIPRAPRWMQQAGIEWLWRWFREPKRIRRILTAVVLFPIFALWDRMKHV